MYSTTRERCECESALLVLVLLLVLLLPLPLPLPPLLLLVPLRCCRTTLLLLLPLPCCSLPRRHHAYLSPLAPSPNSLPASLLQPIARRARLVDASATLTCVVTEDDGLFCRGMADYIHHGTAEKSGDKFGAQALAQVRALLKPIVIFLIFTCSTPKRW